MSTPAPWLARGADYLSGMAASGAAFHVGLAHGTMTLELYRSVGRDDQSPHRRDELYIVHAGTARFRRGDQVIAVGAGDTMFVPAHMPHRFEHFSADFGTWVVFWGPDGGEA